MFKLCRRLLFLLPPEMAHTLTLSLLSLWAKCGGGHSKPVEAGARTVMGLHFSNPVGIAAGLDKNAQYLDALGSFGVGFIEVGTVTPRPQAGNPKPRIFRLPKALALINRLGFNNQGVDAMVSRLKQRTYPGVLGVNIGKNADTPMEKAIDDYICCLQKVYPYADYITVNISSPNTKDLRSLQESDNLDTLLAALQLKRSELAERHNKIVPLAIKIAPDMDDIQIKAVANVVKQHKLDAVIATNTTVDKTAVSHLTHGGEQGGLSGEPVKSRSTQVIKTLHQQLGASIPIIGVGGIMSSADAKAKFEAGASLVQIYTGLIYQGPALVCACIDSAD